MEVQTPAEQLFFTTVRIETSTATESGTATAFIFSYEWDGKKALFLVTNKHVVTKASSGTFFFTISNGVQPQIGQ
jgi:S1-C subfamily serine protease